MTDLPALLAKVEALTGPDREVDQAITVALHVGPRSLGAWAYKCPNWRARDPHISLDHHVEVVNANGTAGVHFSPDHLTGSVDDVLALVERALPDDAEDVISEALAAVDHRGWTASEFALRFVQEILAALLTALISKGDARDV